jgi:hypothetical protein
MNGLRSGFSVLAMVARPRPTVGSRGRQEDPEQYAAQLNGRMGQALGIVTNVPPPLLWSRSFLGLRLAARVEKRM